MTEKKPRTLAAIMHAERERAADSAERDARHLAELPPVPMWVIRNGTVGVRPSENPGRISDSADVQYEILPVRWRFDPNTYRTSPANARLVWYTRGEDNGVLVEVRCWIAKDPARLEEAHERDARGRIARHHWILRNDVNGEQINYASGDHTKPGERLRFFYNEPGNGPTLADYLSANDASWPTDEDGTPVDAFDVRGMWTEWKP